MHTHIEYATPQKTDNQWSKMAVAALAIALANPLLMTGLVKLGPSWILDDLGMAGFGILFLVPLVFSVVAAIRLMANASLKGMGLMTPAFVASIGWPAFCVYWFFRNMPNC